MSSLSPAQRAAIGSIEIVMLGAPARFEYQAIDLVEAYSCKHLLTDPPASKGDALSQLRMKALEVGAEALVDVSFDQRGTDAWGTNCWETVYASGVAAKRITP